MHMHGYAQHFHVYVCACMQPCTRMDTWKCWLIWKVKPIVPAEQIGPCHSLLSLIIGQGRLMTTTCLRVFQWSHFFSPDSKSFHQERVTPAEIHKTNMLSSPVSPHCSTGSPINQQSLLVCNNDMSDDPKQLKWKHSVFLLKPLGSTLPNWSHDCWESNRGLHNGEQEHFLCKCHGSSTGGPKCLAVM